MKKIDRSDPLITFPCHFPIKVIGDDVQDFYHATESILNKHNQNSHPENLKKNSSQKGNYIAHTINLKVDSQKQLDAIYKDFSGNDHFKFVL